MLNFCFQPLYIFRELKKEKISFNQTLIISIVFVFSFLKFQVFLWEHFTSALIPLAISLTVNLLAMKSLFFFIKNNLMLLSFLEGMIPDYRILH